MQISSQGKVSDPGGQEVKTVREAVYLGGLITCDGKATAEISRRLGESRGLFKNIRSVCNHAAICTKRKLEIYSGCILPRLLYSLESLWLLQADRHRLDSFHCWCLRRILKVPDSYFSRVSNSDILLRANMKPLSELLLERQKKILWSVIQRPDTLVGRLLVTETGALRHWSCSRRRGRPRQRWGKEVFKLTR